MSLVYLKDEKFSELTKKKVLVDFYADWCGPCKMVGPVLEELSSQYDIVKVNVDNNQSLAMEYSVMSIPTLIVFENGKEIKREIGFRSKEDIIEMMR